MAGSAELYRDKSVLVAGLLRLIGGNATAAQQRKDSMMAVGAIPNIAIR
jgi:hypothetical protein